MLDLKGLRLPYSGLFVCIAGDLSLTMGVLHADGRRDCSAVKAEFFGLFVVVGRRLGPVLRQY